MLELSHISKTYKTSKGIKTNALKDINLKFPLKGMVFILGKSGSGKSTLLNIIGGLDQADEGEVILHGKSSRSFSPSDYDAYRNTYIGFIFQEFYLMEEYTIEKNIALSLQLQQKQPNSQEIEDILNKVGLSGYGSRYPNELSGGQKQRVAIARSLIKRPEILMADEPTGALDSTTGKEIFDTLKELSQEKLVIVVSHDEEAANKYADRIIRFSDGEVIEDTNSTVEADNCSFVPIKSHLPFKDSFHLGITCLKHKKIRMIFTILLTSFALLTLALSDSVGSFNTIDAQYKAMNDNNEHIVGIRRQIVDNEGYLYINWMENRMEIRSDKAASLINEIDGPVAKVYDSMSYTFTLNDLGIYLENENVFDAVCTKYYLTEMNGFEDLQLTDIIGSFPKDHQEIAISAYLADQIIAYGINDENNKMIYPKDYQDVIAHVKLPIAGKRMAVSGIVKHDYSAYEALKKVQMNNMTNDDYILYRMFSNIVNQNSEQLFVKDGFVKQLNLPKQTVLSNPIGIQEFRNKAQSVSVYANQIAYPTEAVSYYDGKQFTSTDHLAKDEVLWNVLTLSDYFSANDIKGNYDINMQGNSDEEKEAYLKGLADRIIGKEVTFVYNDLPFEDEGMIEQTVTVKGVVFPSNYTDEELYYSNNNYVSEELIAPLISDTFYIGELLVSKDGAALKDTLKAFTVADEYTAHTIASEDVRSVQGAAEFLTKVFFYASIAFFCFAAALMMNFIVVSINYRKKEIGILRSIGARSLDVMKIFIWEAMILALISYIVTNVALFGLSHLVNVYAKSTVGLLISPVIVTLRQPILLVVIVLVISFVASFIPIMRIAKQRPIDAIKKS